MKCVNCGSDAAPEEVLYCPTCGKVYCAECARRNGLCDCFCELSRFC